MRQGSTVATALIVLGLTVAGFTPIARSGEPLDDRLGIRTVPIFLLTRSDVQADLKLDAESNLRIPSRGLRTLLQGAQLERKSRGGVVAAPGHR